MHLKNFAVFILTAVFAGAIVWAADDGTIARVSQLSSTSYMEATISAAQTTNVGAGDHIKFDTKRVEGGSLITLDTSTSYVNTQNTASIGRFTLTGGHTYRVIFNAVYTTYAGDGSKVNVGFWNSDGAAIVGQATSVQPQTNSNTVAASDTVILYVTPSSNTRYEIRFLAVANFTGIGVLDTYNFYPTILIENIN